VFVVEEDAKSRDLPDGDLKIGRHGIAGFVNEVLRLGVVHRGFSWCVQPILHHANPAGRHGRQVSLLMSLRAWRLLVHQSANSSQAVFFLRSINLRSLDYLP
jgi:hypothetical protein